MFSFFLQRPDIHRVLHSFPTRRSSDLRRLRRGGSALFGEQLDPARRLVDVDAARREAHRVTQERDRKSTRLNSSHRCISYAVFCLKKKIKRPLLNYIPKT